jgi:hypothetical protein
LKTVAEKTHFRKDAVNISILLSVALFIGIYLIATTAVIAKDGVTFIEYAKQLETATIETITNEYQHPGYPFLIFALHKATGFLYNNTSIFSWIYCGQSVTLLFRLIAIIVFYFIGKKLLDARMSFWAILILILLPKPGQYGSDVLSDWPHICFLGLGLLLLLNGTINKKWWLFGFAGLASGLGYLIRPESTQLVISGGLWLGFQLIWPKRTISRGKALSALILLLAGFLVAVGPYMKLKGVVFPKKSFDLSIQSLLQIEILAETEQAVPEILCAGQFAATNITKAFAKLGNNIGNTLMWFFVPALLIGMHSWFKTQKWYEPKAFFIIMLISINVSLMIWLYCKFGYMSDRHILPLLMILIFYVPLGLLDLSIWIHQRIPWRGKILNRNAWLWFLTFFLIGIFICAPKLFRPIRIKKQGYRAAAEWLSTNTNSADVIAVPDIRISFYAGRTGIVYSNEDIPSDAGYVVVIAKNEQDYAGLSVLFGKKADYKYTDNSERELSIFVYQTP